MPRCARRRLGAGGCAGGGAPGHDPRGGVHGPAADRAHLQRAIARAAWHAATRGLRWLPRALTRRPGCADRTQGFTKEARGARDSTRRTTRQASRARAPLRPLSRAHTRPLFPPPQPAAIAAYFATFAARAAQLQQQLGAAAFFGGDAPSWPDFTVYHWWDLSVGYRPEAVAGLDALAAWAARVRALPAVAAQLAARPAAGPELAPAPAE
jgi:hypothetical protein